jgi:solute carrier family 13 (sodium-dependent dicarboxylate transporter), member 2/3/5
MGQIEQLFGIRYGFGSWMMVALPIVAVVLPLVWWWITRGLSDSGPLEVPHPGPWRTSEIRVLAALAVTALAWIFRAGPAGGWAGLLPTLADGQSLIGDTTIAIAAAMFMFICPSGDPPETSAEASATSRTDALQEQRAAPGGKPAAAADSRAAAADSRAGLRESAGAALLSASPLISPRLLSWPAAARIHWGILLMFGGGLALAEGFQVTGLSEAIGRKLSVFSGAPPLLIILSVCLLITFMTEITSSTATASLMLPILGGLAIATELPPESVMIAGTISASCAFMLPVATAPNVIVFAAGGIKTTEMARNGLMLNFLAALVIATVCYLLLVP